MPTAWTDDNAPAPTSPPTPGILSLRARIRRFFAYLALIGLILLAVFHNAATLYACIVLLLLALGVLLLTRGISS